MVKWVKSPKTVKEDMVAQLLRWQGKPAGAKPKPKNPVHGCDISDDFYGLNICEDFDVRVHATR